MATAGAGGLGCAAVAVDFAGVLAASVAMRFCGVTGAAALTDGFGFSLTWQPVMRARAMSGRQAGPMVGMCLFFMVWVGFGVVEEGKGAAMFEPPRPVGKPRSPRSFSERRLQNLRAVRRHRQRAAP